ncbi:MAG: hypothetical protein M1818_003054 [Claussenomyces sp. TS43310]|nr:MAG: hypothetical protein M1818_003054 [Claussenomyces sp. TS43310]
MARSSPQVLRKYLLGGCIAARGCLRASSGPNPAAHLHQQRPFLAIDTRGLKTEVGPESLDATVPFRKQLKDEAKRRKANGKQPATKRKSGVEHDDRWELTVGIEIHAQLNTPRKLFSNAASTINDEPNTHVALFDLAVPGSQPIFQKETLIPAIRAALALNCSIQQTSKFDRKHYFHWDQPAGYQITQYYEPFARDGCLTLYVHDGIAAEDGEEVRVGIKQIQMEQDTAKTIAQPGDVHLLDFNRVGLPLIEIITLPQIHSPSTAAAFVKKVQSLLNAVDSCVLGMESGGLRADVNVSVRRREGDNADCTHAYAGMTGLGQRTEIKNLSSFKAVKDAIIAERDRQIRVLEAGGVIEGETRGWTIGSSETKRLRGKEGEVDYRYMPDPDLAPVVIGQDLLDHLKQNMGISPEEELLALTGSYGLTTKDALSVVALDDGGRVEYFYNVVDELRKLRPGDESLSEQGRICGNWVLHELGALAGLAMNDSGAEQGETGALEVSLGGSCIVPAASMAQIIHYLLAKQITSQTAKGLLSTVFTNARSGRTSDVKDLIEDGDLWYEPMTEQEYDGLARAVMDQKVVQQILKGQNGKIMFLVGQMMRKGDEGRVDPKQAEAMIRRIVEEYREESG